LAARHHGAAGRHDLFEDAIDRSGDFEYDFVGLEVDEVFFATNGVAGLLVPSNERSVGYGLWKLRNLDLDAHRPTLAPRFHTR